MRKIRVEFGLHRPGRARWRHSQFGPAHPNGHALYLVVSPATADRVARVEEIRTVSAAAHAALWRALLGLHWVSRVEANLTPEDPLPYPGPSDGRLGANYVTPRRVAGWIDEVAALEARTYRRDLDAVVEVDDGFLDVVADSALTGTDGKAGCRPGSGYSTPHLVLDLDVLGQPVSRGAPAAMFAAREPAGGAADADTLYLFDSAFGPPRRPDGVASNPNTVQLVNKDGAFRRLGGLWMVLVVCAFGGPFEDFAFDDAGV